MLLPAPRAWVGAVEGGIDPLPGGMGGGVAVRVLVLVAGRPRAVALPRGCEARLRCRVVARPAGGCLVENVAAGRGGGGARAGAP